MYTKFWKRVLDFSLSLIALIVLSPLLIVLTIVGMIVMKGNPFFVQLRPGMIDKKTGKEKIIRIIKFRSMSNEKDKAGNLLPDSIRLNAYGRFLRQTSLDELPSLVNVLKSDISIVGPRPLLVEYLPYYTEEERHRHDVRPGITGWAQVNGRNTVEWSKRFALDVEYVNNISFAFDVKIILLTVKKVICRSDISDDTRVSEGNFAEIRKMKMAEKAGER